MKPCRVIGFLFLTKILLFLSFLQVCAFSREISSCIDCHSKVTPGYVADWKQSMHAENGIECDVCHGDAHTNAGDAEKATMPDETVCGMCHEDQLAQFASGKHSHGWSSLNALPVTHLEPPGLMDGSRGCGGCHNMGIKSRKQKEKLRKAGYRYQVNPCDECHTRHTFSKQEARNPRACQQCHMGYDHPQWEMWQSAKHGTRFFTREAKQMPQESVAPKCQDCHLPGGTHANRTAWGFFGVRLPLPSDQAWRKDQETILKALGLLDPETGKPTRRLETVKKLDMIRFTREDWKKEREKILDACSRCHSRRYAASQLEKGDEMIRKADHLLARAIRIVAGLYRDGILEKPEGYAYPYPDFWYFLRTDAGTRDQLSYIEQVLFQMYMKHRMRVYQGCFHLNPDYAYWYGWAMMTKDLGEIQELAAVLRKNQSTRSDKHINTGNRCLKCHHRGES